MKDIKTSIRNVIKIVADYTEIFVAIFIGLGLIYSIFDYIPRAWELLASSPDPAVFLHFLEDLFNIVIGIEFIKMLVMPKADNVIEVLIFVIARHMIIGANTSADFLLSVLGILLLYATRMALHWLQRKQNVSVDEDSEPLPAPESEKKANE